MIIDKGCFERGCACYDSRIADETVEVVEKRDWVPLSAAEVGELYRAGWSNNMDFAAALEAKLREKNG